jgi:hypothetical protein
MVTTLIARTTLISTTNAVLETVLIFYLPHLNKYGREVPIGFVLQKYEFFFRGFSRFRSFMGKKLDVQVERVNTSHILQTIRIRDLQTSDFV